MQQLAGTIKATHQRNIRGTSLCSGRVLSFSYSVLTGLEPSKPLKVSAAGGLEGLTGKAELSMRL